MFTSSYIQLSLQVYGVPLTCERGNLLDNHSNNNHHDDDGHDDDNDDNDNGEVCCSGCGACPRSERLVSAHPRL